MKKEEVKEPLGYLIHCPKCSRKMVRSGVLGDDTIHLLNRASGQFHTQTRLFGSQAYRCKNCQIIILVLIDPSFREGYLQS